MLDLAEKKKKAEAALDVLGESCKHLRTWVNENAEEIEKLKIEKKYSATHLFESHMVS